MENKHIIELLDTVPFGSIDTEQLNVISAHIESCDGCRGAYEAARVADMLVKKRASVEIEPSPFFQTRVLAAWRERKTENVPVLVRLASRCQCTGRGWQFVACK